MGDASDLFFFAGGHVLVAPAPEGRGVTLGFCQGKECDLWLSIPVKNWIG